MNAYLMRKVVAMDTRRSIGKQIVVMTVVAAEVVVDGVAEAEEVAVIATITAEVAMEDMVVVAVDVVAAILVVEDVVTVAMPVDVGKMEAEADRVVLDVERPEVADVEEVVTQRPAIEIVTLEITVARVTKGRFKIFYMNQMIG
jgi:hypothetical protein